MAAVQRDLSHQASNLGEHAKDMAHEGVSKVKEMAQEGTSKVKEMASAAGKSAGDAASYIGKKAEDATCAVGAGMKNLAGTIRDKAPDQGVIGAAGSAVAKSLEAGGRYLQEQGLSGIGEDLTNVIRRNPLPAILVAVGIGYLVARATTNRS